MRNLVLRRKAFGALSSPNIFLIYFAINLYSVIFQKELDMANQALHLQTHLRHPGNPQQLEMNH